jgi:hypothetical protein
LPDCENIRFHPALKHPDGGLWPAMVCLVDRGIDEAPLGIHRTFLSRDGAPSKAPISPNKMMLGPCRGGAVRLRSLKYGFILISEGIETGLAAMRAVDKPVWAALSTSGMKTLWLPPHIKDVTILADGDNPGEAAARDAALHWKNEGRRILHRTPAAGDGFQRPSDGPPAQHRGGRKASTEDRTETENMVAAIIPLRPRRFAIRWTGWSKRPLPIPARRLRPTHWNGSPR